MSLASKLALVMLGLVAASVAGAALLTRWLDSALLAWSLVCAAALGPTFWLAHRLLRPLRHLLRALSNTVASYREGDFSVSLSQDRNDELGALMAAHNELGLALRAQRAHLVQRELLLDTVMQNSPVALLLVDAHDHVTYANLAARHLLREGRSLNGLNFEDALQGSPPALRAAALGRGDSLFSVEQDGIEETFHLSQRSFVLQGRNYRLYLLKRLTRELSRQEVSTWKKLIRVLSHELNNSLGPLSSLAHSGAELARRADVAALPAVFTAIGERARHLHHFIDSYATFARLPAPRLGSVDWAAFVSELASQQAFMVDGPLPSLPGWFDRGQVEQVLINLLKNAHEAGGVAAEIRVGIWCASGEQRIEVRDRGSGMSTNVLAQALLPFYSTKRSGTGLGLALAREVAEAHGGRILLSNRAGGGLSVRLELPLTSASRDGDAL